MAGNSEEGQAATPAVAVRPDTLTALTGQIGATIQRREPVRVWSMSGVERLYLSDGATIILKYAVQRFAREATLLKHAARYGVPVPRLLAEATQSDGSGVMLLEDLGEPVREAALEDAPAAAVAIHACPPFTQGPVLDAAGLAELPRRAIGWLDAIQASGRWQDADGIRDGLTRLTEIAGHRAEGAELPPFGLCHSEFHPTSIHIGPQRWRVLDLARAYTGPGLLDLVSWQGTGQPLDLAAVAELIDLYVAAGGPKEALADRGGLPAHVWASGWDKIWIIEWFLEATHRYAKPVNDVPTEKAIAVHLAEALQCLAT